MEKLLLVDGNSMLFRAYFATVYGQSMTTSTGIPTNAIYGFALMITKAIEKINPDYIVVAFDHSKETYRHKEYPAYKANRNETDPALKIQFPIVREYLDALHITRYEQTGLEGDDIIGCLAKQHKEYEITVLTSDKDLLQLVDDNIKVFLMHKGITDIEEMDEQAVMNRFSLKPIQIIDMKGLSGDKSDNIPGVAGVGDTTATKLLNEYQTIEGIYEHIDEIKGKMQEKLLNDKDNAFLSKHLATIITDEKIDIDIHDCKYQVPGSDAYAFYSKYEMKSLAKRVDISSTMKEEKETEEEKIQLLEKSYRLVSNVKNEDLIEPTAFAIDEDNKMVAIINEKIAYDMDLNRFVNDEAIKDYLASEKEKIVYDCKKWHHLGMQNNFELNGKINDVMILSFLCDVKVKSLEDLLNKYHLVFETQANQQMDLFGNNSANCDYINELVRRIYALNKVVLSELSNKNMNDLYYKIELPLAKVLADMENTGIAVNSKILDEIAQETLEKMNKYETNICQLANKTFNVNSPKQLAEVIYDDLKLARSTKRSTDAKVLSKLIDTHPIIANILEYRKYAKLYSTYAFGLKKYISEDGKIHTIYNQCVTETGRLSSSEPNLQNISVRDEEASAIREAFIPDEGCVLVGADYSQVELRMLAHMANEENLIQAFKDGLDIHTKTAMDVFGVREQNVTPLMRRQAKAINFGIDYGMSAFGLSENLSIPVYQAAEYINSYYQKYPKIKQFMDNTIETCQVQGYITTLCNRRREIPEIRAENHNLKEFGKRAAMNAPVQGSAADLMKIAMIDVYNALKEKNLKSKMILQIHDEMILNVPLEEKEIVMKLVEEKMENAMQLSVPLVAKATFGNNWLEVK